MYWSVLLINVLERAVNKLYIIKKQSVGRRVCSIQNRYRYRTHYAFRWFILYNYISVQGAGNVRHSIHVMSNTHHRHEMLKARAVQSDSPTRGDTWHLQRAAVSSECRTCREASEVCFRYLRWGRRRLIKKTTFAFSNFQDVQTEQDGTFGACNGEINNS